jgi:hypothetical protein
MSVLKRTFVLGISCVVLLVGGGLTFWNYGQLRLHASFANEQTQVFDGMWMRTLQSTALPEIAGSLEYVVTYYPSGSKQREGLKLDHVVERYRTAVVREIVAHFRRITGQDLGDNPTPWIQKYGNK